MEGFDKNWADFSQTFWWVIVIVIVVLCTNQVITQDKAEDPEHIFYVVIKIESALQDIKIILPHINPS